MPQPLAQHALARSITAAPCENADSLSPRRRILLVDDDATALLMYQRSLARYGYEVTAVGDGLQALEALKQSVFDLLITDHHMPHISGMDLIRGMRHQKCRIPSVLMSGHVPPEARELLAELSPGSILQKPFGLAQLLETVDSLLTSA